MKNFIESIGICVEGNFENKTEGYLVKVTANALNIRADAGTNYNIVGCIRDKETYTIIEPQGNWERLKYGAGWVCKLVPKY